MADRQYDTTLPVRVDTELLARCKAAADSDNRTLGSWVRAILSEAAELENGWREAKQAEKSRSKKVRRKA